LLELPVLLLKGPQPSQFGDAQTGEPLLSPVERFSADPKLANDLGHRSARLSLPHGKRDLLFCAMDVTGKKPNVPDGSRNVGERQNGHRDFRTDEK
jgi:hypothetical protein